MKNSEYLLIRNSLMSELANQERTHIRVVIVETLCGLLFLVSSLIIKFWAPEAYFFMGMMTTIGGIVIICSLISATSSPSKNEWWTIKFLRLDDLYEKKADYEDAIEKLGMIPEKK